MNSFNEPLVLSIDIGTSSVRCQVYESSGRAMQEIGTQIPYSMTYTPDGGAFIDLQSLCDRIYQTIDSTLEEIRVKKIPITAVACCTFWHNVAGIDATGTPCTPLLSWNDTRPETILPELCRKLDPQSFTHRTGCPMHASYLPSKITWFHATFPAIAKKVRYWMSLGEYLHFQLTGQRVCSISMASASGLLDSTLCQWDPIVLNAIPADPSQFSLLVDANQGIQHLHSHYAQRWPELRHAVWYPALGDGACSNIGSGCTTPERVAMMVGTSGAMRAVWRGAYRNPPEGLWCYRIDRDRPIQGGALSNGGNLIDWLRDSLDLHWPKDTNTLEEKYRYLDQALRELPPDGHGLTFLPFLAGQRSPRWNAHRTGTLHGLRLSTKPIEIIQAGMEAVAFRFQLIHTLMQNRLSDNHVIIATGGSLLHSGAWVQILADVLGRDVFLSTIAEASCRGASLIALESLGVLQDRLEIDLCVGERVSPRPEAHTIYQLALQRHMDFEMQFN